MDIQQKSNSKKIEKGQDVSRYLVYFSRILDKRFSDKEINIVNISGLTVYRKHKKICDKALVLQEKYGIDLISYIKFFLSKFKLTDDNIERLLDSSNIVWYANDLEIKSKYYAVYKYVLKSAKNIVNECIKGNFVSINEYLKYLIQQNLLASKFLSGEISQYYLAGIKNLQKIVLKMDIVSQETLKEVVENQDKLVSDMQDAFVYFRHQRVSIISFTNSLFNRQKDNN